MNDDKAEKSQRLLIKITRDSLPQVKDKYPFIYLERGRLEIDDSSVFPTPVGVFPDASIKAEATKSLPHARGGVSTPGDTVVLDTTSSPRPWGCF